MATNPRMVHFTPAKYRALKRCYEDAVKEEKKEFFFEGHALVTEYAKYLLEYLKEKLGE